MCDMVRMKDEIEKAYPRQCIEDKDGEYRYLYTECGNSCILSTLIR